MPKKVKNSAKPKLSVVIPAFNETNYIARTLASLNKLENRQDIEVIVVDNNSTDDTAYIAASLGARIIKESQPGVCWARQAGTAAAKGEIVVSTDADTNFGPDWLVNIQKAFQADKKIVLIAGPCRYIEGPSWGKYFTISLFGLVNLVYKLTGYTSYVTATNIAFKKSVWPGYNTHLTQGGDEVDLLRRMRKEGRVKYMHKNLVFTSSRRLTRGFFYNFFVSFLFYYLIEYNLSRIVNHPVFGTAPKFRDNRKSPMYSFLRAVFIIAIVAILLMKRHSIAHIFSDAQLLIRRQVSALLVQVRS